MTPTEEQTHTPLTEALKRDAFAQDRGILGAFEDMLEHARTLERETISLRAELARVKEERDALAKHPSDEVNAKYIVPVQMLYTEAKAEVDEALRYARSLAEVLWAKHYKAASPNWGPLETAPGVLTQIDNMCAGLSARVLQAEELAGALGQIAREEQRFATQNWPDYRKLIAVRNNATEDQISYPACLSAIAQVSTGVLKSWTASAPDVAGAGEGEK